MFNPFVRESVLLVSPRPKRRLKCHGVTGTADTISLDSRARQANVSNAHRSGFYSLSSRAAKLLSLPHTNGLYQWKEEGIVHLISELHFLFNFNCGRGRHVCTTILSANGVFFSFTSASITMNRLGKTGNTRLCEG